MALARHIVVAINPSAAFGKNARVGDAVVAQVVAAGHEVTVCRERDYASLRKSTALAIKKADALLVVGGDGMVSLGINLVAKTKLPLGVIPTGTGNDFARATRLPLGAPATAVEHFLAALEREPTVIDLARASKDGEHRWFVCILSAGFDAIVNERANTMTRPRGKSRYTLAILRELLRLKPLTYTLTIDGVTTEQPAILISVANGESMGGGMRVAPEASVTDGRLDVFVLAPVSRRRFLWLYPRVFSGTHVGEPEVSFQQGKRVTVDAPDIVAYADGERLWSLPIDVEVVAAAARVLI
jgi:diacylglycerol kinase (ATP)